MFKKWFTGIFMIALCCSLIGCRGQLRQDILIMGSIKEYSDRSVLLSLSSTLRENSVIHVTLKEIGSDQIAWKGETKAAKDGFINYEFKRPEISEQYKLEVLFIPEKQPASIKKIYGESGEYIRDDSLGYRSYTYERKKVNGIVMYGIVTSFDQETDGKRQHKSWNLVSDFANLESMLE
jgi:hypothetical protein